MNNKVSMYHHLWQSLKTNRHIMIQTTDRNIANRVAKAVRKRKDLDRVFKKHRELSGKRYQITATIADHGKLLTLRLVELNSIDSV